LPLSAILGHLPSNILAKQSEYTMNKYLALSAITLLCLAVPALADEFTVTGQTNTAACAAVNAQCAQVSFNLDLMTQFGPGPDAHFGNVYNVSSTKGLIDGLYSVTGSGGWLLPVTGNPQSPIPYGGVFFTLNSQPDEFYFDDAVAGSSALQLAPAFNGGTAGFAYVTWNVSPVGMPEPSNLAIWGLTLLGFVFAGWKKYSGRRQSKHLLPVS
jgi:hypothetical protein